MTARQRLHRLWQCIDASLAQAGLLALFCSLVAVASAQDAAAQLKCSVRTIYNACAAHGTSFGALVIETRLVAAQYQLIRGRERISQVAYAVGFSSLSHFSRLFRSRFGITAKAMRAVGTSESSAALEGGLRR